MQTVKINGNTYEIGPLADLRGVNLRCANLLRANLHGADLRWANLCCADLHAADLRGADLRHAHLSDADLHAADLRGADLRDADLRGAKLGGANLDGTCLAGVPGCTPAALEHQGWEVRDGWVYGVRTRFSQHVGTTEYAPGTEHEAPYLSVDHTTACHPGIYMCRDAAHADALGYGDCDLVLVRARHTDVVTCAKGLRCKRIEVVEWGHHV